MLERKQLFRTNISLSGSTGSNPYFQLYIQTKSKSSECNSAPALTFRKQCLQVCILLSIRTTLMANQTVLCIMKTLLCTQKRNSKVYILALHNYHELLSKSVLVRTELKLQQWFSSYTVPRQFGRGGYSKWNGITGNASKFLCKSHWFFHSCAVPSNERIRYMLNKCAFFFFFLSALWKIHYYRKEMQTSDYQWYYSNCGF